MKFKKGAIVKWAATNYPYIGVILKEQTHPLEYMVLISTSPTPSYFIQEQDMQLYTDIFTKQSIKDKLLGGFK